MNGFFKMEACLIALELWVLVILMSYVQGNLAVEQRKAEEARVAYEVSALRERWIKVDIRLRDGTVMTGYVPEGKRAKR